MVGNLYTCFRLSLTGANWQFSRSKCSEYTIPTNTHNTLLEICIVVHQVLDVHFILLLFHYNVLIIYYLQAHHIIGRIKSIGAILEVIVNKVPAIGSDLNKCVLNISLQIKLPIR